MMQIETNNTQRSREQVQFELMEKAFLKVTNYNLKPEIARHLAYRISTTLDYDNPYLMHQSPTSRAKDFALRINDEHFINGKNNVRK